MYNYKFLPSKQNYLKQTTPHFKMEALFLDPKYFDSALDIIEAFAKEIFSGNNEIQKFKLSERLKCLLNINAPEKSCNPLQTLEVKSSTQAELPDEIWLKIIQYLPTKDLFENFALSCKKLHNLSQDSKAIKSLLLNNINTWSKYESVTKVISKSKGLVQLISIQSEDFVNELICQTFVSNPNLRTLNINTKALNIETIITIAKSKVEFLDLDLENRELGQDEITALCNIKTLKSLGMNPNNQIISTLAKNSTPIEAINFLSAGQSLNNHVALNEFFKSKKDNLKAISFKLRRYDENVPLKNLNLCQNLERIVMARWHSKNLEMLSGMPNLKHLELIDLDAKNDTLVNFFRKLSLKKLEHLSIQHCPDAKEEFFVELSKLDFPALKNIGFFQTWQDKCQSRSRNLTDNTLQTLISKCPNLKRILFGHDFDDSNLRVKTLMDIFEKRNIFMYFGRTHYQFSMEQWFLNHDKNVYDKYQKLKPIYM